MQDEIVFLPDRRGIRMRHAAAIFTGFFVFVQLLFLDTLQMRVAFTIAFFLFLVLGFWLSAWNAQSWPQQIVINRTGISHGKMKTRSGVELIPWSEIASMDLFYTDARLPPHLRIGLKPGTFRDQIKKSRLHRVSMGLDVNIPVSVNATPETVLQTAKQYWKAARHNCPAS